jgi:hypothetical protein
MTPDSPAASTEAHERPHGGASLWIARVIWVFAIAASVASLALHRTSNSHADLLMGAQVPQC